MVSEKPVSNRRSKLGTPIQQGTGTPGHALVVDVRVLLDGHREAVLVLDGEPYRLRITAKDKLILTK
jgi:hemin uptake protein HemP